MPVKNNRTSTRGASGRQTAASAARASGRVSGRVAARRGGKGGGGGRHDNKAMIFGVAAVAVLALGALAVAFGGGDRPRRPSRAAPREETEAPRQTRRPLRDLTTKAEIAANLAAAKQRLAAAAKGGSNAARNRDREEANLLCDEVLKSAVATERDKSEAQKLKYQAKKTMTR